jgi:hypothetical protein
MKYQQPQYPSRGGRKKSRWKLVLAIVALASLSCGLLIALDVRKVAAEKKHEQKLSNGKTPKPALKFPPLDKPENDP